MHRWTTSSTTAAVADHGGPDGATWAAGVDAALDRFALRRGLTLVRPLSGGAGGSCALVRQGSTEVVCKTTFPPADGDAQARGLAAFAASGAAPRLLAADLEDLDGLGQVLVMLCERVTPGRPLGTLLEPAPVPVLHLSSLLDRLARADRAPLTGLGMGQVHRPWTELDAARRDRLAAAGIDPDAVQARNDALVAALMASSPAEPVHGDLHPGNLLWCSRRGLVAVDPRPALGDPAFDVGYLALTATCGRPDLGLVARLASARGCDPARALAWASAVAPALLASTLAWPWGRQHTLGGLMDMVVGDLAAGTPTG